MGRLSEPWSRQEARQVPLCTHMPFSIGTWKVRSAMLAAFTAGTIIFHPKALHNIKIITTLSGRVDKKQIPDVW